MKLTLPVYPFWPHPALEADPKLLDALLQEQRGDDALGFLLGVAPMRVFGRICAEPVELLPGRSFLWLMHVSGYFGGVWLRAEIRRAQPGGMLEQAGQVPTREAFAATLERAGQGLAAAQEDDAAALAQIEGVLPELIAGFGYNQGYLLQILEAPPEGLRAPAGLLVPRGPLWCDYGRPRLGALPALRDVSERLALPPDAAWRELAALLDESLEAEVARGRSVWSSGLSVRGFPQESYERLLDVSSSFLEIAQATVLLAVRALALRDGAGARRAALAWACTVPWLGSYAQGLMDNRHDASPVPPLPRVE